MRQSLKSKHRSHVQTLLIVVLLKLKLSIRSSHLVTVFRYTFFLYRPYLFKFHSILGTTNLGRLFGLVSMFFIGGFLKFMFFGSNLFVFGLSVIEVGKVLLLIGLLVVFIYDLFLLFLSGIVFLPHFLC